ncbi:MAG: glutaredoxin family protein [Candidatus Magnetoovum sp. WYHC-5]|nr:glutaredoxin family protein [Candidatus Magnetoovum sp. WYHC-5]
MESKHVLFALSTCAACKKVKELLRENNIEHIGVDLDLVDIDSRDKLLKTVRQYNPKETFPTFVVDGGKQVIVGYNIEMYKKEFNIKGD